MKQVTKQLVKYFPEYIRKKLPKKITVVTIDEAESRRLNRMYGQKDRPTNVLSFRYSADYAEILVCSSIMRREAKEQGNSYSYQMTWMVVHGMLHGAGMHHEYSAAAAKRVENLEKKILAKIYVKNSKCKNQNLGIPLARIECIKIIAERYLHFEF